MRLIEALNGLFLLPSEAQMEQRFTSLQPTADLPQLLAVLKAGQPEGDGQPGRSWYSIKNISNVETEIFIYDVIGSWGVSANDFVRELNDIRANKITLRINSPGGDVFDGIAIYNAVKRHKATVSVFVDGVAASAAAFIAMAGDSVTMMPHSQMMIHEASGLVIGPADDMRKMADFLDKSSDNIARIYAERAVGDVKEWRELMRAETWFSDEEAVAAGLADRIEGQDEEAEARLRAQHEPEPEVEPEVEPEPEPDFLKVFENIADEAEEAQYVGVGG